MGDINTYVDYPYSTTLAYTLTSATYITTTRTLPEVPVATRRAIVLPTAPGIIEDCEYFVEYVPIPPVEDQHDSPDVRVVEKGINSDRAEAEKLGRDRGLLS